MQSMRVASWLKKSQCSRLVYLTSLTVFVAWLLLTPPGLLGKADAVAYAVCHRIDLRSLHLGVRQLPLCARCTGMYLGALLGIIFQVHLGSKNAGMPPKHILVIVAFLVLAFLVDGLNSFLSLLPGFHALYSPDNRLRLFTGTGMGVVLSIVLFPAFNQTVWSKWNDRPSISRISQFGLLMLLSALMDLILLTENPLFLYPLALLSAAGVLVLLSMVYTMTWLILFHAENRFNSLKEMVMPLTGGFTMSMFQVMVIDLGRLLLTGTWNGFLLSGFF